MRNKSTAIVIEIVILREKKKSEKRKIARGNLSPKGTGKKNRFTACWSKDEVEYS